MILEVQITSTNNQIWLLDDEVGFYKSVGSKV